MVVVATVNVLRLISLMVLLQADPTLLICHSLPVSDCQTLTESKNDPSRKIEEVHERNFNIKIFYSTYILLAEIDKHQVWTIDRQCCEFNLKIF